MIYVDTHCHLNDEGLYAKRQEVVARASKAGVGFFLCVGYDLESSKEAVAIAQEFPSVYAAVGYQPENIHGVPFSALEEIKALAKSPKVLAIGEIGLDYHWKNDFATKALQKEWFLKQIDLANEVGLPVSIHCRDASGDALEIVQKHPIEKTGVFHCYSGSVETMMSLAKLGFYFGFDGPITYKHSENPKACVKACPLDRLLTETDSPYLPPEPYRGTTNESSRIIEIEKEMALLRNMDPEILANQVLENTEKLFHVEF